MFKKSLFLHTYIHPRFQRHIDFYFLLVSSVAQSCLTLGDTINCSRPIFATITNSQSLLKLMSIELVMPTNQLILCHLLLLLPSIFPSIRVFSNVSSVLRTRWSTYWSFSFSISPSSEYFDWFVIGLTCLILQSKGLSRVFSNSTVQKHQFFGAQLSL